jgi:cyclophilin family peptidyl-prolyl cis-trans isomerase
MANRSNSRTKDRAAASADVRRRAAERAERRRRIIAVGAVAVVLLAVVGTMIAAANDKSDQAVKPATTSTVSTLPSEKTTPSTNPGPTVSVVPAAAGATLSGPTPCPAEDGSSPRTTLFAGPPPNCVDPSQTYDAVISTSVGDLKVFLNTKLAPTAVNNFVVLARYHYYDGSPLVAIISQKTMAVGSDISNPDGRQSPGYTLPGDYPKGGTIFPTGTILMVKVPGQGDHFGGAFQIALGDKAADLPADSTAFGLTLDGTDALVAINKAGTDNGAPTKAITITSVRIELAPATTTTTTG